MAKFNENFWQAYQRFLKVALTTESPDPRTADLSSLAQNDVEAALRLLFSLDLEVIQQFKNFNLAAFKLAINHVLGEGGRVFLIGCGASGRMAMQMEYLWRQEHYNAQIKAVLAGGDIALIEAVEGCEDEPAYAIRHLKTLNLSSQDLVIGLSAGGESPFILSAIRYAVPICQAKPWLIYCNPDAELIMRDPQHVLAEGVCENLCLDVGPMALTGSTRMQATTIMTLVLLSAFFNVDHEINLFTAYLKKLPLAALTTFMHWEAQLYQHKHKVLYQVPDIYGLSILADTTERSPTFNVATFESDQHNVPALAYMILQDAKERVAAWTQLLLRAPESLNWFELPETNTAYLKSFDLSSQYQADREQVTFTATDIGLNINYQNQQISIDMQGLSLPLRQLLVRLIMINHSTVVFGRLGFYQGNLMTFVKPSNFKLIDRVVRYVQFLAETRFQQRLDYQAVAYKVLVLRDDWPKEQSIVDAVLKLSCAKAGEPHQAK